MQHLGRPATKPFLKPRHTTKHPFFPSFSNMCIMTIWDETKLTSALKVSPALVLKPPLSPGRGRNAGQTGSRICVHTLSTPDLWSVGPWHGFAPRWDAHHHQNHGLLPQSWILNVVVTQSAAVWHPWQLWHLKCRIGSAQRADMVLPIAKSDYQHNNTFPKTLSTKKYKKMWIVIKIK